MKPIETSETQRHQTIAESRIHELEQDLAEVRSRLIELEQQKMEAESALYERHQNLILQMKNSLSWRITRPVRWISSIFRRQRGA